MGTSNKMIRERIFIKPAVNKWVLLLLAGIMWLGVGTMMLFVSYSFLEAFHVHGSYLFCGIGITAALIIYHFGFLKVADRNLNRILPMEGPKCVFSFISWKSYILVAVMIALGWFLRHSGIPKLYLSVIYIGIGLALILSSFRYLRASALEIRKNRQHP
jgi:hypothetical protein